MRIGLILAAILCLGMISDSQARNALDDRHVEVALRSIGHEVLLISGDSTSRVLPVKRDGDRYMVQFEKEFDLVPEFLVAIIDSIFLETRIAQGYIVQVEECESQDVVYSFEIDTVKQKTFSHCLSRGLPLGCYNLMFTLLEPGEAVSSLYHNPADPNSDSHSQSNLVITIIFTVLILAILIYFFFRNRRGTHYDDPDLISLGDYQFDKRNAELRIQDQKIELTGKEADLLSLLYGSVNNTVERDVILNRVWGDEGDYVGRTLDVFISKLRKKLEADSKVKIVNIRGIGYKLVMNR